MKTRISRPGLWRLPPALRGRRAADPLGAVTGLPLPRYASLKTDRVNLREGPSKDHSTKWVFQRAGLPVEITAEFATWRKVRDSEGAEGWVLHTLLSRAPHRRWSAPAKKEQDLQRHQRRRRQERRRRATAGRRDRQHQALRRRLVPGLRRRVQGLCAPDGSLGRVSRREGGVDVTSRRRGACATRPASASFIRDCHPAPVAR